jgi:hypothetical protein
MAPAEISSDQLTLTVAQMQNRWAVEQQKLRLFSGFQLLGSGGTINAAEGSLSTQYGNSYRIRIELANYPYSLPKVKPKDWKIHPDSPHKFIDDSICIMRSDQWRKHFTVALVVAKTAIWLGKYEIWKRNGHYWPGLGQSH